MDLPLACMCAVKVFCIINVFGEQLTGVISILKSDSGSVLSFKSAVVRVVSKLASLVS